MVQRHARTTPRVATKPPTPGRSCSAMTPNVSGEPPGPGIAKAAPGRFNHGDTQWATPHPADHANARTRSRRWTFCRSLCRWDTWGAHHARQRERQDHPSGPANGAGAARSDPEPKATSMPRNSEPDTFAELSRHEWALAKRGATPTDEQLRLGCQQRIADALESLLDEFKQIGTKLSSVRSTPAPKAPPPSPSRGRNMVLTITAPQCVGVEESNRAVANLIGAIDRAHRALGGNGITIESVHVAEIAADPEPTKPLDASTPKTMAEVDQ